MLRQAVSRLDTSAVTAAAVGLLFALTMGASAQERAALRTFERSGAYRMAFSPDSTLLAVAELSGDIVIWDVALGKPRHILKGNARTVTQLAFAPDGITLIAAHTRLGKPPASVVKHWDVVTGQEQLSFVLEGGGANWALSADGRILVTVQGYPNKTAKVWDLTTRKVIASLDADSPDVRTAAVAPVGNLVAIGGSRSEVKIFEVPSGKPRGGFKVDREGVRSLKFSRDGRLLAAVGKVSTHGPQIWDVVAGKEIEFPGRLRPSGSLIDFAPDGKVIFAGSWLWSLPGRARLAQLTMRDKRQARNVVLFSPNGRLLAMGGSSNVSIWDVPKLKP